MSNQQNLNHNEKQQSQQKQQNKETVLQSEQEKYELVPKGETYMERKLRKINEEVIKSFGDCIFLKSFSKIEKETFSQNNQQRQQQSQYNNSKRKHIVLESKEDNQLEEDNETEKYSIATKKVKTEKDSLDLLTVEQHQPQDNNQLINSPSSTNNQSDMACLSNSGPSSINKQSFGSTNSKTSEKSIIQTVEKDEKCIDQENCQNSTSTKAESQIKDMDHSKIDTLKQNQLKQLKKNLNSEFTQSLDELMAHSKKRLPKMAAEKQKIKEIQEQKRAEELKQMKSKDQIFKWDHIVFNKN